MHICIDYSLHTRAYIKQFIYAILLNLHSYHNLFYIRGNCGDRISEWQGWDFNPDLSSVKPMLFPIFHTPFSGLPHNILALYPFIPYSMCLCLTWTMAFTPLVNGEHMLYLSSMGQGT